MTAGDSARSATGGLTSAARDARELVSGPAGGLVVHAHIPADHSTRAASAAAARAPGFVVHVRIPAERKRAMVESGAVGERRAVGEDRAAGATGTAGPGRAPKGRGRAAKTPESAAVRAVS
ncbi:hypothetical protein H0264_35325 [Nocardia huaxiensis]|uniref:Uncharacterized protein n=1 Tax=Nocardia huaxiensis TaxID=2755382 RepID=A0A7D6ZPD1_9NOCA|nr:hypothetical protein [Nocardia huaxiensis]QLY30345.1 hypothetical protein H0264_35325 [Nocardia huaxiensis]